MSNQRPSFAKREREMKLKDKARAKAERRAARRAEARTGQGPPIATEEEANLMNAAHGAAPDTTSAAPATTESVPPRPR
jgi:hypothetical protein